MKKILIVLMTLMMIFVFSACNGSDVADEVNDAPSVSAPVADDEITDLATEEEIVLNAEGIIEEDTAKRIAAEYVGADVFAMQEYHFTLKLEHGVQAYDISFIANGREYNIYVNATNGEVMSYESELVD